jgi:hypothetical protein
MRKQNKDIKKFMQVDYFWTEINVSILCSKENFFYKIVTAVHKWKLGGNGLETL